MTTNRSEYTLGLSLNVAEMQDNFLPLGVLIPTLRDLNAVLAEIETAVTGASEQAIGWEIEGDPAVRVVATVNGVSADTLNAVVGQARNRLAQAGQATDSGRLRDVTPQTWRRLRSIVGRLTKLASVTITATGQDPVVIPKEEAQPTLVAVPRQTYVERSEVIGELDIISVRGTPHFVLYEHGTDRSVRCVFPDRMMPQVKEALGRRIVVEGFVRYRADGSPMRVTDVARFLILPEPQRDIEDFRGALPSIGGDLPSGEFIHRLRVADDDR